MDPEAVALVIVDISGYTQFIRFHRTTLPHAQEVTSQLLESVIDKASHPLVLNKLEGDAAFLYAALGDDPAAAARDIAGQVAGFFAAFHGRSRDLSAGRAGCACDACQRIRDLQLKAVLHVGEASFRRIRQFEELAGEDVILVHRLLKNSVAAHEYVLMTEAFHRLLGDAGAAWGEARVEAYDDLGPVAVRVSYPTASPGMADRTDSKGMPFVI